MRAQCAPPRTIRVNYSCIVLLGRLKDEILAIELQKYKDDPDLKADIINAIPQHADSTLNAYRRKVLGSFNDTQETYDPSSILGRTVNGDSVIVLDSQKHLPEDWHSIKLSELFPPRYVHKDLVWLTQASYTKLNKKENKRAKLTFG